MFHLFVTLNFSKQKVWKDSENNPNCVIVRSESGVPLPYFVEYPLFSNLGHECGPGHVALSLTSTVIKRALQYAKIYPKVNLSMKKLRAFRRNVEQSEEQYAEAQLEVSSMLEGIDGVVIVD